MSNTPRRPDPANRYDWSAVDWSRCNADIARALGCNDQAVHLQRRRRRLPPGERPKRPRKPKPPPRAVTIPGTRGKFPWALVDWRLSNTDLAELWGCLRQWVTNHRCQQGRPAAMWPRANHGGVRGDGPEYRKALAAERRKAKAWRASLAAR